MGKPSKQILVVLPFFTQSAVHRLGSLLDAELSNGALRSEVMPAYLGLLLCLGTELLQLCGGGVHAQALLAQLHDPLKVCQLQRSPGASVVPLHQAQVANPSGTLSCLPA